MSKILFMTDPHGIYHAFEHTFEIAEREGIETIVLGGDLLPKRLAMRTPEIEIDSFSEVPEPALIIPRDMLTFDSPSSSSYEDGPIETCYPLYERLKKLNEQYPVDEIEAHFRSQGYVIHQETNQAHSFESIFIGQDVYQKIADYFGSSLDKRMRGITVPPQFNDEELAIIHDLCMDLYDHDGGRAGLISMWRTGITGPDFPGTVPNDYDVLKPSATLTNFFRYFHKADAIVGELHWIIANITQGKKELSEAEKMAVSGIEEKIRHILVSTRAPINYRMSNFKGISHAVRESVQNLKAELDRNEQPLVEKGQIEFVENYLRQKLEEFKARNPGITIYAILGNDDMRGAEAPFKKLADDGLIAYIDNKVVELADGHSIAGYAHIPKCPDFYDGWHKDESEIKKDLKKLVDQANPDKLVLVTHVPPHDCALDLAYGNPEDEHIGSAAVREIIEETQPLVTLHGHVHESFKRTGRIVDRFGNTVSFNPGAWYLNGNYCGVIVDLDDPNNYTALTEDGNS